MKNPFIGDELLEKAFSFASHHHQGQFRKGGKVPYITHPVAVAKLLLEHGYPREVVAAGLLHDVLEDTACDFDEIHKTFGGTVSRIVAEVTEKDKAVPWKQRKIDYLNALRSASEEALAVACADKIHNLLSMAEGLKKNRTGFAQKFSESFEVRKKNYHDIYELIRRRLPDCPLLPGYFEALRLFDLQVKPNSP